MELTVTVDAMEPFVRATYDMEGDGPLVLYANLALYMLMSHCHITQMCLLLLMNLLKVLLPKKLNL